MSYWLQGWYKEFDLEKKPLARPLNFGWNKREGRGDFASQSWDRQWRTMEREGP